MRATEGGRERGGEGRRGEGGREGEGREVGKEGGREDQAVIIMCTYTHADQLQQHYNSISSHSSVYICIYSSQVTCRGTCRCGQGCRASPQHPLSSVLRGQ